jgi:replicative DNA helicase
MTEPAHESAEKAVIGSMLLRPMEFHSLELDHKDLTLPDCRRIFQAMAALWDEGTTPDVIAIADWTDREKGRALDAAVIADMTRHAANQLEVAHGAKIITRYALDRRVRLVAKSLGVSEATGDELLAEAMTAFNGLSGGRGDGAILLTKAIGALMEESERRSKGATGSQILTGMKVFDDWVSLERGAVLTVAGRPSMGKSALVLWMMDQWAKQGERALLFSTETGSTGIARRFLAKEAKVNSRHFGNGDESVEMVRDLHGAAVRLHNHPIWIDDESDRAAAIARTIRLHRQQNNISVVVIDHIQECIEGDEPRNEINKLLSVVRSACRESPKLGLVLVSQLSRRVENRESKRPQMSDLKESGKIEETSDGILLAFRPYYYADVSKQFKDEDKGQMWLNIAKNRDGKTGWLKMLWDHNRGQVVGPMDIQDRA